MPLLQGIIQILIEHSNKIWGLEPPASARNSTRPLSTLFVGKDLTILNQMTNEETQLPDIQLLNPKKRAPPLPPPRSSPLAPRREVKGGGDPNNTFFNYNSKNSISSTSEHLKTIIPSNSVRDRMKIFEPHISPPISPPSIPQSSKGRSLSSSTVATTKTKLNLSLSFDGKVPLRSSVGSDSGNESPRKKSKRKKKEREKERENKALESSV